MNDAFLYSIIREIVQQLHQVEAGVEPLPENLDAERTLVDLGLDLSNLPEIRKQLKDRLGGRDVQWDFLYEPMAMNTVTLRELLDATKESLETGIKEPIIVYVDDEEENLFIFKRKFGQKLRLVTFTDPKKAFDYIRANDDVRVVITDEVMPGMSGNELCDEVHKLKPFLGFILITGNPNSDEDLMYNSLKRNRFYEFINKPMDLSGKGEEYLNTILSLAFFGRN